MWHAAGLLEAKESLGEDVRLIFYCGSGWRSALAWLLARLMGLRDVASFDGGIFEYGLDARRPLEAGEPGRVHTVPTRPVVGGAPGQHVAHSGWRFHVADASLDSCDDEGPSGQQLERRRRRQQREQLARTTTSAPAMAS